MLEPIIHPNNNHNTSRAIKTLSASVHSPSIFSTAKTIAESHWERSLFQGTSTSTAHKTHQPTAARRRISVGMKLILDVKTSYHKLCFYAWQRGNAHNRRDPPGRLNERTLHGDRSIPYLPTALELFGIPVGSVQTRRKFVLHSN